MLSSYEGVMAVKMKEVCAKTGLTERAVRFYVQEGLVSPASQRRGGRTWLDFSEGDIARLKAVAALRKAGFTLEEIRSMGTDFRQNAPAAAFALRQRLREAIEAHERLARTDPAQAEDLEGYAALLEREVRDRPLPPSDQEKPMTRLNWPDIVEWTSMAACALVMLRLYVWLLDRLSWSSPLLDLLLNPFTLILAFPVLFLPVALVLGSRLGKWLCRHFEYVP